eukprot:4832208-Pyramimonas_sp.AAC.1
MSVEGAVVKVGGEHDLDMDGKRHRVREGRLGQGNYVVWCWGFGDGTTYSSQEPTDLLGLT